VSDLAALLDRPAVHAPERPALIIDDGTVWSYQELRDVTDRWAAALAAAGVGPGDRVALADRAGVRSTAVTLAAVHLGAATAQLNPQLTRTELAHLVEVSRCASVAVASDDAAPALSAALGPGAEVLNDLPAVDSRPVLSPPRDGGGSRDALVLFTSGTTGLPKAVPVTGDALMARMSAYRLPFAADRPPNTSIMCVPSFHIGGMLGLLLNLFGGDTTVVQPRFDAGRWLALVEEHRVASAFLVPAMLARVLDHPDLDGTDLSSLRTIGYGAAAAPVGLVRRAMEALPDVGFANVFGQTETLGAYTTLLPADHHDPQRIGSVGRPLPGVEVRVVDPVTGGDLGNDAVGELWVRSTQNVVAVDGTDGWYATGDLARRDGDGYLYPVGRLSETINRGGEKFAPAEVADALRTHPAVADVAVAGVPDDEMGQRVGVLAVPAVDAAGTLTLRDLRDHCRSTLAPFKLPEVLVVVDALPVNDLGKLPRQAVTALIVEHAERGDTR
jgi:acyl-CoA synthetase (AMP-forming)/AMP-acid ligase II